MSKYYRFEVVKTGYVYIKAENDDQAWDIINNADLSDVDIDEVEWNLNEEVDADVAESGIYELIGTEDDTDEHIQSEVS